MDGLLIALVVAALVIGVLLMLFIQLTSKQTEKLDRERTSRAIVPCPSTTSSSIMC